MPVDPQPPISAETPARPGAPAVQPAKAAPTSGTNQASQQKTLIETADTADVGHGVTPSQWVLSYHFSEPGRHLYFQIIDAGTGKVIRQVPPAEVLNDERRVAEYLQDQAKLQQQGVRK